MVAHPLVEWSATQTFLVSSRNPGGALCDDATNGCVADRKEKRSIEDTR